VTDIFGLEEFGRGLGAQGVGKLITDNTKKVDYLGIVLDVIFG